MGAFLLTFFNQIEMKRPYVPLQKTTFVTSSAVAGRILWHPYSLGTIHLDKPDHHAAFEKPGAHLFWVVSGRGTFKTQDHQYALEGGDRVWFMDMMKPRTYAPQPGTRLTIRGIRFGGPGLEAWLDQLGGNFQAEFDLGDASSVHQAYREIARMVKRQEPGWEWQIHLTLSKVLGLLLAARNLLASDQVALLPTIRRVIDAIAANPFHDWKVKDLSAVAGVSYSSLRAQFLASQRLSLHDYLLRQRLDQTRLLLADRRLSLKQIAQQMHFSSEFYFSHFFKRREGMSPSQYRNQLKEKR